MNETTQLEGAGTLTRVPDGPYLVRFVRAYDRPVEDLWNALTEPELLDSWYPTKLRTDGVVGNPVTETFESKDGTPPMPTPPGTLTAYDPPHVFEYRIHGPDEAEYPGMIGEQRIRMEATPGGHDGESVLTFTHEIGRLDGALDVLAGWHYCLEFLALAMGAPGEPTEENIARYKAYYLATYGGGTEGVPVG